MIDELCELLQHQVDAATALEGRLRALELVVAADEHRFVPLAVEELEAASERLAALELARALALGTAGLPDDVAARDLVAGVADPDETERLRDVVDDLAAATARLVDARERAGVVVTRGARASRERLYAASTLAAH